jgi:colanic acid biosynthesis glycosyl transferase WcaI
LKTPPSILFLNRVYPPAEGATGQLLSDLATALARQGHEVTVLTSGSVFSGARSEVVDGVRIERVDGMAFTRASHWRRALSYLSLYPALLWRALRLPRADVVVTLTDPPLLALLGAVLQMVKGSKHVHWAQDLYPELAEELSVLPRGGFVARALRLASTAALRRADRVVAVGRCMKERLERRGVAAEQITVIPNWGHAGEASTGEQFRREHGLEGRFVIMYSGNLGLAHPFEAMLDAAAVLQASQPSALWLFVGDGPRLPWVREQVAARGLTNVRFLPYQPRERLGESLAAADVHVASMRDELCGLVVPSKVYGVVAAARPCIFLGPEGSEAARFLMEHQCGAVLPQAGGRELAGAIERWISTRAELERVRRNASDAAQLVRFGPALAAFGRISFQVCGGDTEPAALVPVESARSFRRESAPVLVSSGAGESSRRDL